LNYHLLYFAGHRWASVRERRVVAR